MNAYREAAAVPALPTPEHVGPRDTCPSCGASDRAWCDRCKLLESIGLRDGEGKCPQCHYTRTRRSNISRPRLCTGSWWRWCFRRDPHLHQSCRVCGGKWTCAPVVTS